MRATSLGGFQYRPDLVAGEAIVGRPTHQSFLVRALGLVAAFRDGSLARGEGSSRRGRAVSEAYVEGAARITEELVLA